MRDWLTAYRYAALWRFAGGAVLIAFLLVPSRAYPQGSRFESFFNDAQRFLEKQGRAIERELQELSSPEPPRPSVGIAQPPLPERNPRSRRQPAQPYPAAPAQAGQTGESVRETPPAAPAQPPAPGPSQAPPGRTHPPAIVAQPPAPRPSQALPGRAETPDMPEALATAPLPERNPALSGEAQTAPEAPPHPREVAAPQWTAEQIDQARLDCEAALDGVHARYIPLSPIREGQCGTPYPISLSSLGSEPAVAIDPPATLTCAMAAALNRWLEEKV